MKNFSLVLLMTYCATAYTQSEPLPKIDFSKSILTVAHYNPSACGLIDSGLRSEGDIEALTEVMDKIQAYDLGTGFVYEHKGEKYIITCEHVIFRADSIVGYDADYNSYELELVGGDTFYDVAILKFKNEKAASALKGVEFDTTPEKDSEVWSVGYWKANGTPSAGHGKVLNGNVVLKDRKLAYAKMGFIRSDAHTAGGYSGGVLYNREGKVLGMNNSVHIQNKVSHALKSSILKRIISDVLGKEKRVKRSFLGIQFSQHVKGGIVIIDKIMDDSPAAKYRSELAQQQVRTIQGQKVQDIYDVLRVMENIRPGTPVIINLNTDSADNTFSIITETLNREQLQQIALHTILNHKDECERIDIDEDGFIIIITDQQNKEIAKSVGIKRNLVYCLNSLEQLGTVIRIFGLHRQLKIGTDDAHNAGRWIYFSEDVDRRVLYY